MPFIIPSENEQNNLTIKNIQTLVNDLENNIRTYKKFAHTSKSSTLLERAQGVLTNVITRAIDGAPHELTGNKPVVDFLVTNKDYLAELYKSGFLTEESRAEVNSALEKHGISIGPKKDNTHKESNYKSQESKNQSNNKKSASSNNSEKKRKREYEAQVNEIKRYISRCKSNLFTEEEIAKSIDIKKIEELRKTYAETNQKYNYSFVDSYSNVCLGALIADRISNFHVKKHLESSDLSLDPREISENLLFTLGTNTFRLPFGGKQKEKPEKVLRCNLKHIEKSQKFLSTAIKICTFDSLSKSNDVITPVSMKPINSLLNNKNPNECKVHFAYKAILDEIEKCKEKFKELNLEDPLYIKEETYRELETYSDNIQEKIKELLSCDDKDDLRNFIHINKKFMIGITRTFANTSTPEITNNIIDDIKRLSDKAKLHNGEDEQEHNAKVETNKVIAFNETIKAISGPYIKVSRLPKNGAIFDQSYGHMHSSKIISLISSESRKKINRTSLNNSYRYVDKYNGVVNPYDVPHSIANTVLNDPKLNFSDAEKLQMIEMIT